jgi:hypothetical protein
MMINDYDCGTESGLWVRAKMTWLASRWPCVIGGR